MIKPVGFNYSKFNFPVGETHVVIKPSEVTNKNVSIEWEYENDSEIIEMLLITDALKRASMFIEYLFIPYVPYGRQDRINQFGESLSIDVFCSLVNYIGARTVSIIDPHSDVTPALIKNCEVKYQWEVFADMVDQPMPYCLISPDGGALKKIYKLSAALGGINVIECSKERNTKTGEITGIKVNGKWNSTCIIVDDICDGGRTFIEIAKVLKKTGAGKIVLMVTHGFFTKGLQVFDGLIDEIYTRKGRVK